MAYNASNNGLFAEIVIYSESAFENLKVRIFHKLHGLGLGAKNFFPKICAAYVFWG